MRHDADSSTGLPERLDEALNALWRGESDKLDRLIAGDEPPGQGVGEIVRSVLGDTDQRAELPDRIAHFAIMEELGRGGMGVVYKAAQQNPKRLVALKVIRGGPHVSEQHVRYFEREVQTLARLKHPNIATIHEAGRTDEGLHYFAMELVEGTTLTEFARGAGGDSNAPASRDDLLRLFIRVCGAISYAHQRGVIHRDLKPSNILVSDAASSDGSGSATGLTADVKVLDFGLARITDEDMTRISLAADSGRIKGTLAYMSPEQARGDTAEIDTRSDVYSLGVILYELMSGRPPYALRGRSLPEAVRTISEVRPPRPGAVDPTLRGDLETIILKAVEKDPAQRYASAAALGEDIGRFLSDQPILARAPSSFYQLSKLVKRHKLAAAGFVVAALSLLIGFAVSATMYVRMRDARAAEHDQRVVAEEVNTFLTRMLASVDPRKAGGRDVTLIRELLEDAARRVHTELAAQPRVQAPLERTIGEVYLALGLYERADVFLTAALDRFRSLYGPDDPRTLAAANNLASLRADEGRLDEAEVIFRKTIAEQQRILGPKHPDTLLSMHNLGNLLRERGRMQEAEKLLGDVLDRRRRLLGETHPDTLLTMNHLAKTLAVTRRFDDAERLLRTLLRGQLDQFAEDHPDVLVTKSDLAVALKNQGKLIEAEPLLREALAGFRRTFGDEHPDSLIVMYNLATLLGRQGKQEEAVQWFETLVALAERALPDGHHYRHVFVGGLGQTLLRLGRFPEAETALRAALDGLHEALGDGHVLTQTILRAVVELYETTGRAEEARRFRDRLDRGR